MQNLINQYLYERGNNLSENTKYVKKCILNKFVKSIDKHKTSFNRKDILNYLNSKDFKDMETSSQNRYKYCIKCFSEWVNIDVKDILKPTKEIKKVLQKSELLSKEEVRNILKLFSRPIDKAMFILFLETKARKSELLNLKIKDLTFYDSYGMIYIRESKTAQRNIPIIESIPYLTRYLEDHPLKDDMNAYVFGHKFKGRFVKYSHSNLNKTLNQIAKLLDKRLYPHLLRHTGLTEMAKHLTEFQLKQMAGWTFDSKQASRYVHLSNDDLENKILELHNIKPPKKEERINNIEIVKCPRCDFQNSDLDRFCSRCGSALNIQIVLEQQELASIATNDYSTRELEKVEKALKNIQQKLDNIKSNLK